MDSSSISLLKYVFLAFALIAVAFWGLAQESPMQMFYEVPKHVEQSPRLKELLSKSDLRQQEMIELKRLSYEHFKNSNPNSKLTFEDWQLKYLREGGQ